MNKNSEMHKAIGQRVRIGEVGYAEYCARRQAWLDTGIAKARAEAKKIR